MSLVRAGLEALPLYVAGRRSRSEEAAPPARLASNESPWAPLPSVQAAMHAAVDEANRYPDMGGKEVIDAIAFHLSVPSERVAVGNGSSSLIRDLVTSVAGPGDEIVFPSPSFQYYANAAIIAGATPVRVPLNEQYQQDLGLMLDAITPNTRAVFICNPNNPTGRSLSRDEISAFVSRVPQNVMVVVDEAYIEFCDPGTDSLPLLDKHSNVAVLRTFSKAYGLAGIRIGYLIAAESLIEYVRRVIVPFALNSFAQAAACASLTPEAQSELRARVIESVRSREQLAGACEALGIPVVPSRANFLFLPLGEQSQEFVALCEREGILVRAAGNGVRITVGAESENRRLLSALTEWAALMASTSVE